MKTGIFWRICFITHRFFGGRFCFTATICYICTDMRNRRVVILESGGDIIGVWTTVRGLSGYFGRSKYSYIRQKLVGRDGEWVEYKEYRIMRIKLRS